MPKAIILCALESEYTPQNSDISVIYTGVGKLNAAFKTYESIMTFKPDMIINFGTAGGLNEEAKNLVEISKVVQRDMIAEPLSPRGSTPFSDEDGYLSSGYEGFVCGSGDSFVTEPDGWLAQNKIDLVDMELYGIAFICKRFNMPWRSFKFISDTANENAAESWTANIQSGEELFTQKLATL